MSRAEIIAIPDLHFPWSHDRALAWLLRELQKHQPRYTIQLGDLYDQYCFSKYPKNPNLMLPKDELKRGREKASAFWHAATKACPSSKRKQLRGNHDVRIDKRIAERLPELQGLVSMDDLFQFPDVETVASDRHHIEVTLANRNKVVLLHGWMTRPGSHLEHFEDRSVIFGHLHRPHLISKVRKTGPSLFELNAGYLADPNAPVFEYGGTVHKKWTLGYGLVDENGRPEFVGYPGK